jgi:hypothetical protein
MTCPGALPNKGATVAPSARRHAQSLDACALRPARIPIRARAVAATDRGRRAAKTRRASGVRQAEILNILLNAPRRLAWM